MSADQPHNARSLQASGAGIAIFDTDTATLRNAIERVLVDEDIQRKVRQIAAEIAAMPDNEAATDELLAWRPNGRTASVSATKDHSPKASTERPAGVPRPVPLRPAAG